LRKHLEQHHEQKFKELLDIEEHKKSRKRSREDKGQPRIDETLDALNPYHPTSQQYIAITRAVAGMIAADFQPFSVVEDEGFRHFRQALSTP